MKNILFADDDENFRFTIKEYFSDSPWHWEMAENGVVALDHALSKRYDLIILDINMPFMKGTEAIKVIKTHWPGIRVLAFTADSTEQKIAEYYKEGFDGVVAKPIELVKLHQTISKFLDPHYAPRPSNETVLQLHKHSERPSEMQPPGPKEKLKEEIPALTLKEEEKLSELPPHLLVKNIETLMKEKRDLQEKIRKLEHEIEILKMAQSLKPSSSASIPIRVSHLSPASEPEKKAGKGTGIPTFEIE